MATYRKLPIEIEAFKAGHEDPPLWFNKRVNEGQISLDVPYDDINTIFCYITTLEGIMAGNHGDYIILGTHGEVYPCKPDVFKITYEKVAD